MLSERVDAALALLRAEYLETPTLLLTAGEAAELLDLTRTQAVAVLQALEDSGFWPARCFIPVRMRVYITADGTDLDSDGGGIARR